GDLARIPHGTPPQDPRRPLNWLPTAPLHPIHPRAAPETLAAAFTRSVGAELPAPPRLRCSAEPPSAQAPVAVPSRCLELSRSLQPQPRPEQRPDFTHDLAAGKPSATPIPRRRWLSGSTDPRFSFAA